MRPHRKKWLFTPNELDDLVVEEERERLETLNPGVKITRADAIRSLFARVRYLLARETELVAELAHHKTEELQGAA